MGKKKDFTIGLFVLASIPFMWIGATIYTIIKDEQSKREVKELGK